MFSHRRLPQTPAVTHVKDPNELAETMTKAASEVVALRWQGVTDPAVTPTSRIFAELAARLTEIMSREPADPSTAGRRSGNGYGGVELRNPLQTIATPATSPNQVLPGQRPNADSTNDRWIVFAGYIRRTNDEGTVCWHDVDSTFEEWLITILQDSGAHIPDATSRTHARSRASAASSGSSQRRLK